MLEIIKNKIEGKWVNTHSHLDRAYTASLENIKYSNESIENKWALVDFVKKNSNHYSIYDRMKKATDNMQAQGVSVIGTFIDVDSVVGDKNIEASKLLIQSNKDIEIVFINQTLKGVLNSEERKWFDIAVEFVDIVGSLPSTDKDINKHLDIVLSTAKRLNKRVHVHVDQNNTIKEKETEKLINKIIEYKMEGQVTAIHCISLNCHSIKYRESIYKLMSKVGLSVITCPYAWVNHKRYEDKVPFHNALTPVDEMLQHDILVGLGTDNISDIMCPYRDGNMLSELELLLEGNRLYDNIEEVINIATINGKKILGLS